MKKSLLSFFMFLLMFGFQTSFTQEEGEDQGQSIYNSDAISNPQSIFEDGQPIAGSDWEWLHPTPTGSTLNWVQIMDATTGYGAGFGGTFLKSTDFGTTWTVYKDVGGLSSTGFYRTLYDGHFFDANTGLVCGSSGTLLRTTDGGATWDSVGVGASASIYDLFFINSTVGFLCGTTTIDVWKTTDAGLTWTSTGGAVSGTCYGIYAIDEDTLLCAGTSNDVRRSTDGGASWTNVDIGGPTQETLRHVEMSSATDGWVVGDDGSAAYTTDAGATWTFANTGLGTTPDYNDVDILSTTTQTLNEGFEDPTFPPTGWHTKNILGGVIWMRATGGHSGTSSALIAWESTGGEDWLVTPQLNISTGDSLKFWARKFFNSTYIPDSLLIVVSTTDTSVASFTTVIAAYDVNAFPFDWTTQYAVDLSAFAGMSVYIAFRHFDVDGNGLYLDDIEVGEPTLDEIVWATGDSFDMYFTTDMGTSWNPFSHLDPSQAWTGEFFSTDFLSSTEVLTVGTRGMINAWSSPPADAGTALNTWIKSGTLYDIWAQSEGGRIVAVGAPGSSGNTYDQGMYSTDGGDTWAIATSDSTPHDFNDLSMVDSVLGYACLEDNFVYKTTDGGETWTDLGQVAVSTSDLEEIFFVDASTGYTFGASDDGYKTTDGGATWSVLTTGVTPTFYSSYFIDADTGYVVGASGTVIKTTDGGTTFTPLDAGSTVTLRGIWFVSPSVGYICGSSSNVRKTTDAGASWTVIDPSISTTLYDIEFRHEDNGVMVGSSGRTFTTEDGGATWLFENNSSSTLYGVSIENASPDTSATYTCGAIAFIMRNALVIVPVELAGFTASVSGSDVTLNWQTATELNNMGFEIERREVDADWVELGYIEGKGTTTETSAYTFVDKNVLAGKYNYRIKQIDFDGSFEYYNLENAVEVGVPDQYGLSQNYPNPFNPTTKITYSVPVDGFVSISIFNILGEKVTTLINANVKAGNYEVTFDASGIASGMYLYRMESGDFISVKKMMILK